MKKILAVVAVSLLVVNCSTTTQSTAVQMGGHPFKMKAADCQRIKPIDMFDPKCDHPKLGYAGFSDPTIITQSGAPGGLGGF